MVVVSLGPAAASDQAQFSEPAGSDPLDLIFLCVPGYLLLQAALTLGTSGSWRKATLVPAVVMVPDPGVHRTRLCRPVEPVAAAHAADRATGLPLSRLPERHSATVASCQGVLIRHAPRARYRAQRANTRSVSRLMNAAATGPVAGPS